MVDGDEIPGGNGRVSRSLSKYEHMYAPYIQRDSQPQLTSPTEACECAHI